MNGIEKITARIEADAQADAERITDEARAQAQAVRAEGEAKAQETYWRVLQEGKKAAEERARRLAKAADMEARKSVLNAKQQIVSDVFRRAEERLRGLGGEEYVEFVAGQAARAAVTGREEIILNAADRGAYGKNITRRANDLVSQRGLPGALTLSESTGDFSGGMLLRAGDITVNGTIEALMAQAREDLAPAAASALFDA